MPRRVLFSTERGTRLDDSPRTRSPPP